MSTPEIAFIRLDDGEMISVREISSFKLQGESLLVSVPQGDGFMTHYIHKNGPETYAKLEQWSLN